MEAYEWNIKMLATVCLGLFSYFYHFNIMIYYFSIFFILLLFARIWQHSKKYLKDTTEKENHASFFIYFLILAFYIKNIEIFMFKYPIMVVIALIIADLLLLAISGWKYYRFISYKEWKTSKIERYCTIGGVVGSIAINELFSLIY